MKVLIVAAKKGECFSPFVTEQAQALRALSEERRVKSEECEMVEFAHTAHGIVNYMKWVPRLRKAIKEIKPDVVHAHFGLTGLMAGLAAIGTGVPVVVTYHGCDINDTKLRPFSRMAMRLAAWNLFVSKRQMVNAYGSEARAAKAKKACIVPCGIKISQFDEKYVDEAWYESQFGKGDKVLFAGSFESYVKNPKLAIEAIARVNSEEFRVNSGSVELIELKGYTREQVVTLMYKCKALLLTSIREGSPQVVKEAMACGCPVVSTDVGDVKERLHDLDGCYVVPIDDRLKMIDELSKALEKAIAYGRTKGREKLMADGLDNEQVAERLVKIYKQILH